MLLRIITATGAKVLLKIIDTTIYADETFMADLRLILSGYHGRLATQVGNTGDMQKDTDLARRLVELQEAYDQLA